MMIKFNSDNFLQLLNIKFISVTLLVLNDDKFNSNNLEQEQNINSY